MHPLYRDNNKKLSGILEDYTRGTTYEVYIKTFHRSRNGRGAYLAIISQHAGSEKWIIILRYAKYFVNNWR